MTFETLKNDRAFAEAIQNAKDAAEVKALFSEKGMDIAEEDIEKALAMANGEEAELDDEALEAVNGGMDIITGIVIIAFLAGFAKGAKCKK
ncbi:MAG: Nif11-like leader peptide family RiPP precursor [Christensenellaceae bacterium]|nr:Nif11-like leader peptide family RiPP precursor [Christensenellaceae bacterium]